MLKTLLWSVAIAVAVVLAGTMLLLGLPGALWLGIVGVLLRVLWLIPGNAALLPPDGYWPFALILSLLWPVWIPVGAVLSVRRLGTSRTWITPAVIVAGSVVTTIALYALAAGPPHWMT
jgi:hypothetical protein